MIEHGVDGCLVAPQDSTELAEALKWMLSEANLDRMSEQSRLDVRYSNKLIPLAGWQGHLQPPDTYIIE